MPPSHPFTIAICTWNRSKLLRQTLERLSAVQWPEQAAELLVVNNGSSDDTRAVAESFSTRVPVRVVDEAVPGVANARNRALAEASSPHVLFTDDDVLVEETWLPAFAHAIERYPEAAIFGGPIEPWFPVPPDSDLVKAFPMLASGFCGLDHRRELGVLPAPLEMYGANFGVRLAALGQIRFHPNLGHSRSSTVGGEETALLDEVRAAGRDAVWVPDMRLKHYVDPRRLKLPYLVRFTHESARGQVLRQGQPDGVRLAGVPRWVLGVVMEQALRAIWQGITGHRVDSLTSLYKCSYFSGVAWQSFRNAHPGRAAR